jgi:hypothetical protein
MQSLLSVSALVLRKVASEASCVTRHPLREPVPADEAQAERTRLIPDGAKDRPPKIVMVWADRKMGSHRVHKIVA